MKTLLEQYGFFGAAQKVALDRLMTECDVAIGHFQQKDRRGEAQGLHIGFKPAVAWVGQETE